jgi:hypothetical protein
MRLVMDQHHMKAKSFFSGGFSLLIASVIGYENDVKRYS